MAALQIQWRAGRPRSHPPPRADHFWRSHALPIYFRRIARGPEVPFPAVTSTSADASRPDSRADNLYLPGVKSSNWTLPSSPVFFSLEMPCASSLTLTSGLRLSPSLTTASTEPLVAAVDGGGS